MRDEVQYSHTSAIPGLVLSTGRFADFRFEPHYHLDFHVALVANGAQRQTFKGESLLLTPGSIQLMPAGEVHDGCAAQAQSYTLRTFRLSPSLLESVGQEVTGRHHFPSQATVVLEDRKLATQLLGLHAGMAQPAKESLTAEIQVLELFEALFSRIRHPAPQVIKGRLTHQQMQRVRDFMEAHLADKLALDDLATLIGMDRFRFLKQFKNAVGMTPHAWLLRLRLETALKMIHLRAGVSLAEVAHAVGFFDQSHFTRAFQSAYGTTPSSFQRSHGNFLQDDSVKRW